MLKPQTDETYSVEFNGDVQTFTGNDAAYVNRSGSHWVLGNGRVHVSVPAEELAPGEPPPPLAGISVPINGETTTIGGSQWSLPAGLSYIPGSFSSVVTAAGPIFAEVLLNYSFTTTLTTAEAGSHMDNGGIDQRQGSSSAIAGYASFRVRLPVYRWGPEVREVHSAGVDAGVDLVLHDGWAPDTALSSGWAYCDPNNRTDSTMNATMAQQLLPLGPIERLPNGALAYLQPRWSQACDSRYYWGVWQSNMSESSNLALGVLAMRQSEWNWPQYRSQDWYTMRQHLMSAWSDGQGRGYVHLPLYGRRTWYLLAGPRPLTADNAQGYYWVNSVQDLDRLNNVYDLSWPGLNSSGCCSCGALPEGHTDRDSHASGDSATSSSFCGQSFLGENTNPTGVPVRHGGQALLAALTKGSGYPSASLCTLSAANVWCDPDWYGAYVGYNSPENPNFNTDFSVLCVSYSLSLAAGGHPNSSYWCEVAWGVWQHDLRHSVTLPSGAGQESPGYTEHALESWWQEAPLLDKYCPRADGSKAVDDPRYLAAITFLYRTSQPWAYHFIGPAAADNSVIGGRFGLPLGDTHPTAINFTRIQEMTGVAWTNVSAFVSQELQGFGAVLQTRAGTPQETFLALKASPNRGHNHGDQLSLHYAAYGARIVIDAMAGYNPRPYQEYWHNRLCFGENQNQDGYERLIGYRTTPGLADVAVGQVTSSRLQALPAQPPDAYLGVYNVTYLPAAINYRRTAVLVHAPADSSTVRDYVVLVDAHNASTAPLAVPAYTALTFFQQAGQVAAPVPGSGNGYDMGNGTVFTFAANGASGVPVSFVLDRWDWPSEGNENATRVRTHPSTATTPTSLFVTVLYPDGSTMPALPHGKGQDQQRPHQPTTVTTPTVSFDASSDTLTLAFADGATDVITFSGLMVDAGAEPQSNATMGSRHTTTGRVDRDDHILTLTRSGQTTTLLASCDLNVDRWQGDVGLSVTDAGYTFGEVPDWVIAQRAEPGPGPDGLAVHQPAAWSWPPNSAMPPANV